MIFLANSEVDKKKTSNEGLNLSDILDALAKSQQLELEDFQMDLKELQIVFEPSATGQLIPKIKLPGIKGGKPTAILPAPFSPPMGAYTSKNC